MSVTDEVSATGSSYKEQHISLTSDKNKISLENRVTETEEIQSYSDSMNGCVGLTVVGHEKTTAVIS